MSSPPGFSGAPPQELLFPFHFHLDEHLRITTAGPSLRKLAPEAANGTNLSDAFAISAPQGVADLAALGRTCSKLIVLAHHRTQTILRGQVIMDEDGRGATFYGSPWITRPAQIRELGLKAEDFAIHDPVMDVIHLLQAYEQAIQDAKEPNRRMESFFSLSPDLFCIVGFDGRLKLLNPSWSILLGYTNGEMISKQLIEFVHPDDQAATAASMAKLIAGDKTISFENRYRAKDGSWKNLRWNSIADKEHGLVFANARDLAPEIEARELSTRIVEASPNGMILVDTHSIIVLANARAEELFGYGRAELRGRSIDELLPNGLHMSPDQPGMTKSGQEIPLEIALNPVIFNRASMTLAAISDISRRKQMEDALRESEERFRQVAENISEVIWLTDISKNKIIYISSGYEHIWGRSCQSVYDSPRNWLEALHPEDRERVQNAAVTKQARGDYDEVYRITRPDGNVRWIRDRAFPVRNKNGVVYRIAGFAEDITKRRMLEEDLRSARDAALAVAQAKADFLASMSHEIRTPMNSIIGLTGLLLNTGLTAQQKELAGTVRNSGEVLLNLINDILDFSKFESGKVQLEEMPFDLDQLIASTIELVSLRAVEKGLTLNVVPQSSPLVLVGDPGRLRQILLNLVGNAVKFTEKGEVTVSADVEVQDEHSVTLRFRVSDTGIGIPKEAMSGLFDSFTQADTSTTRRFGGTGLGLAIAKKLVTLMGGEIGVESAPDKGSTFWCRVRLRKGQAAPVDRASIALHDKNLPAGEQRERPRREFFKILVVEDNTGNQLVAKLQLRSLGYDPDIVSSGQEALDQLLRIPYDLVIMDCHMPGMDGFAATRALRKREAGRRRTPVLAMTANAFTGDREACLAAEMDDYISKPVLIEVLEALIRRWDLDFDPKPLEKLREIAGPADAAMVAEVVSRFLDSSAKTIAALMKAAAANDVQALKDGAHALKGASGNVGALALQRMSRQLEIMARSGETAGCANFVSGLEREFIKVREMIRAGKGG